MPLTIRLAGKRVRLLPEHALFWKGTLVVAGVNVASAAELARLGGLVKRTRARRLVSLGDCLPPEWRARYPKLEIQDCVDEAFVFGNYALSGGVHPEIGVRGRAGQPTHLPCFCFGPRSGALPAFSPNADTAEIHPGPEDRVYAIAGDEVLPCER